MSDLYEKGTRVRKTQSKPEDTHQDGALATVVQRLGPAPETQVVGYFVHWDDFPGIPVFIAGHRVEKA
jgi:hypothetical protein